MYLKEIILQTKNVSALHTFYSDILELPVKYIDQKKNLVTVGVSKLIFEETNKDVIPFIILPSTFHQTNWMKHCNGCKIKLNYFG